MELPFETGDEEYQWKLPVTYSKADGQAVKVSIPGTDFSKIVPIEDNLWKDYNYKSDYARGKTQNGHIWAYKIRENNGVLQMICSIQLFDKWSDDGLDIVLAYENGRFVIEDVQFCENVYAAEE